MQDEIPIDDVEVRVARGLLTLAALPDRERAFLAAGSRVSWPSMLHEWADLVAQAENPDNAEDRARPRFEPTRADVSDCLTALSWWSGLARLPSQRRRGQRLRNVFEQAIGGDELILRWVAEGLDWDEIGRRAGLTTAQARKRYQRQLGPIVRRRPARGEGWTLGQRLIFWRANGKSFKDIGREINRHEQTAASNYRDAVVDCYRIANGLVDVGIRSQDAGSGKPARAQPGRHQGARQVGGGPRLPLRAGAGR